MLPNTPSYEAASQLSAVLLSQATSNTVTHALSIPHAIVLGLVEGITEYLPVSSTGHLILTSSLLGLYDGGPTERAVHDFEIIIQGGAILAVLGLYFPRFVRMLSGLMGNDPAGLRTLINICIAFVPAAVLGMAFSKQIKAVLFAPVPVIIAMIAGGAFMIIVDLFLLAPKRKAAANAAAATPPTGASPAPAPSMGLELESLTPLKALIIGTLQIVALIPGTSRSMMTIVGGVFTGLKPSAAAEFSFLLGMPTLLAATGYSLYKNLKESSTAGEPNVFELLGTTPILVGILTAAVAAFFAVKWLVGFLNKHGLALFGFYRLGLGAVLIVLLMRGNLTVRQEGQTEAPAPAKPKMVPVKTPIP